ncbi:restriction endonuclease subunit S [Teredinibacter turnerae]|uniref:restriction endonuclease subunit S n=1 Tax=Teredinibacter turnerae TaxID=2426 RepID=UPI0005F88D62|nr:restriction endonuclease subunit S [Teredinibacter turnerae]
MVRSLAKDAIPTGWKYDLLDKFAIRCSGHTPSKSFPEYWNGGIKWISLADSFRLDQGYVYETDKEISEAGIANSSAELHPAETVVLSRDAGIGKSGVMAESMAVSQHFIAWKCDNTEKLNSWFLYNWLQLNKAEFERQAVGSTIKTIGLPFFKKLKIAVPPYTEQKKIAKILSTWDKAITTTEQLLANSQQQKKALMQQLLVGKKRLLDKNGVRFSGEWIHGRLGDLCTFKGGSAFKEAYQGQSAGELPFIKVSDMNLPGNERSIEYSNNWVSVETAKLMKAKPFPESSIVFAKVGAALLLNRRRILSRPTIIDNNMMAAIPSNVADTEFLYQLLMAIDFARFVQEGAVPSINQGDLSSFKLSYPDVEEQQKIAAALYNADQEIAVLQQKLDALKQEKKALMQQLLTGKRRVQLDDQNTKATTYGN